MSNFNESKVERTIRAVVQKMIQQETYDWPPKCTMILYQPKRPQRNKFHKGKRKVE